MYQIYFYKDRNGVEPVAEYLRELSNKNGKDARIKFNKLNDYIETLSQYGTYVGEPIVKHLDGEIWELRPLNNRVLFAAWTGKSFVLLHHFVKKTQKTPKREIETARYRLQDYKERYGNENSR
ncbi:MAG: type II toxin-antitoxin system RelE/ParE family toxin [Neisseriaceae bacterium]|nr:type II toxin-antitoxin system RelE/ParE family toxin [Neisseriaceae bacterium]